MTLENWQLLHHITLSSPRLENMGTTKKRNSVIELVIEEREAETQSTDDQSFIVDFIFHFSNLSYFTNIIPLVIPSNLNFIRINPCKITSQ